jgi:antitoxin component YwqK of YwqJK toxin-antitoxin module
VNKAIILGVLLCLAFPGISQELTSTHLNRVDEKGRKQGYWKVYDSTGELKFEGNYADGKPIGKFTYYYGNGVVKAEVINQDSGRISHIRMYHPNAKLMATGKYVNQKKDSTWFYYNQEDGSLASEEIYLNTLKEGEWKTYYPGGQVMEVTVYHNDIKEGPWKQYFSDGSLKSECNYVNDLLEGLYVIHHLNGKVEISGTYVHSQKDGVWVYLSDIGEMEAKETYDMGNLVKREEMKTEGPPKN